MLKNLIQYRYLIALAIIPLLYSCQRDDEKTPAPTAETQEKYAVWLQIGSYPNTTQYILGTNSLSEGSINLTGHGAEVTGKSDYGIITKGGYYYYHNTTSGRLSKFKYENELYSTVLEVPFTHLAGIDGFTWIDDKTLFLVGTNGDRDKIHYTVVNTETLKTTNGVLDAPVVPAGYKNISLGNVEYTNGKVFVQFGFTGVYPTPWETKTNIGVVDYATLKYEKTLENTLSAGPGTNKLWLSSSFVDDNGNTYFATNVEWSNIPDKKTAIYRIQKGTTVLDESYVINSGTLGYSGVGLWYIGGTKAIIKYIDTAVTGSTHIYAFAVLDLETGKITKKLSEIPNDADAYIQNIVVENGQVYLITNAETGKDYVYIYDIATQTVKTGMEMIGGYDWILRVDKMR
jgi:hypothetical protein